MYAIIEDSGTQLIARKGDVLRVNVRELEEGAKTLTFDQILLIGGGDQPRVGTPLVEGAKVTAEIMGQFREPRVTTIKFKRRGNYHRKRGHKQKYLRIKVTDIVG